MFRFAHPELLYLLIVIPLLIVFYVVMIRRKKKAIAEFGNPELLGPLMPLLSFKRGTWKFVMLMLALLFVIVGVAGPQFGSKLQQVKKKGVELMIALDVSNSMMAQDIKPSRLEKAKMAISRMVEKLSNDKIGLIVFAGDAYVQLPITTDYSSAKLFLSNISTDIVPAVSYTHLDVYKRQTLNGGLTFFKARDLTFELRLTNFGVLKILTFDKNRDSIEMWA